MITCQFLEIFWENVESSSFLLNKKTYKTVSSSEDYGLEITLISGINPRGRLLSYLNNKMIDLGFPENSHSNCQFLKEKLC